MNDEERKRVVDAIRRCLIHHNVEIIYIACCGSHGKGLASNDSDYDTKVITLSTKENYLLQRVKPTIKFALQENGVDVEGVAIDFLTAAKYVTTQNTSAYDIFSGVVLLRSTPSDLLQQAFMGTYCPRRLQDSLIGILRMYMNKKIGYPDIRTTSRKLAAEIAYVSLKLITITTGPYPLPPSYNAFDLIESSHLTHSERREVALLFEQRRDDRTQPYEISETLFSLVDRALHLDLLPKNAGAQEHVENRIYSKFVDMLA